jgi:hypothetical protein
MARARSLAWPAADEAAKAGAMINRAVLGTMCQPEDSPAGQELLHPQHEIHRLHRGCGVEFHPGHGQWISVLRAAGLVVDALHELYAPPAATDHPYYQLATAYWSRRWPVEEIWVARNPAI